MSQAEVLGIIRALLTSVGGGLVTSGVFTSAQWQEIVGALVVVAGGLWSWIQKRQAHAALQTAAKTGVPVPATIAGPLAKGS
jgi:hypothetical protein